MAICYQDCWDSIFWNLEVCWRHLVMFLLHIFVCMAFKICSHPFFGPHGHPNWDIGIRSHHIEVLVSHNSSQICTVVIVSGKCYLVKVNCVLVEKLPFICTSKIFSLWLVNTIPTPPQNLTETACIETKHLWYLDISALCCAVMPWFFQILLHYSMDNWLCLPCKVWDGLPWP